MTLVHVALALCVVVIWGVAFPATRLALDDFSPPALAALRFLVAALPAALLPRPPIAARDLIVVGTFLFTGQFLFQFFGIAAGTPPGLAAVVVQTQGLFTILFSALALRERPTRRQWLGSALAAAGLLVIASTAGGDLTALGLGLSALSAMSWGVGNVLVKRLPPVDVLGLVVWMSLVPPLPALVLAAGLTGPFALPRALAAASWLGLVAVVYLGLVATVAGYAIWGRLLRRYPPATIAPFALLVPFVAALGSSLAFGERFGPPRLVGMALVLLGLATIVTARHAPATDPAAASR
ncbi:MAG TPA: EamA family transporter [Methylomirabilota bacterium]|jgi:O-acetylserine/cysteine efflux transporter